MLKTCPRCATAKPLEAFGKDSARQDGLRVYCRPCNVASSQETQTPENRRRNQLRFDVRHRLQSPELFIEDVDRDIVFDRDEGLCGICGNEIDREVPCHQAKSFTIDHIKPLSRGGEHSYLNVRAAHHGCNVREYRLAETV